MGEGRTFLYQKRVLTRFDFYDTHKGETFGAFELLYDEMNCDMSANELGNVFVHESFFTCIKWRRKKSVLACFVCLCDCSSFLSILFGGFLGCLLRGIGALFSHYVSVFSSPLGKLNLFSPGR